MNPLMSEMRSYLTFSAFFKETLQSIKTEEKSKENYLGYSLLLLFDNLYTELQKAWRTKNDGTDSLDFISYTTQYNMTERGF